MELITKFIYETKILDKEFFDYVKNADDDELVDFISVFNDVISSTKSSNKKNGFNFIANSTLSGLSFPCGDIGCKLNSINSLARNAILYADTVYIQNPFEKYLNNRKFNDKLRNDLIGDLIVLKNIKPLLEKGIFKFATSETHFCHDCYTRFQKNYLEPYNWNLNTIRPLISEYIIKKIDFFARLDNGKYGVEISGNNDLLDHPMVVTFIEFIPDIIKQLAVTGKRIRLNPTEIINSEIDKYLLNEIEQNLSIQNYYSSYYSSHILTDRQFDIDLIKMLNNNISNENLIQSELLKNLNHLVPFIDTVSLKKIIKLRENEGEAFQVYRDKINSIVKKKIITKQDAAQLYLDEIRPQLNKINLTLKNNKKLLWTNIKSNIILSSTYISASLFTGILPTNIDKIVASVGGFGFTKSISQDVMKMIKKPEIRNNELYFLWKLSNEKKHKI